MNLEGDELDEALMDDAVMMAYLSEAVKSNDVDRVMAAAKRVVHARDHREVTLREFIRWGGEQE